MKILNGILNGISKNQTPWIDLHHLTKGAACACWNSDCSPAGQELHKFRGQGVVRTTTVWPGMVTGHHESPRMFLLAFGTPSNIWRIGRIWKNDAVVVGKLETSQITRDSKCQIWRLKCADRAVLNKVPDNGAWRKHQALVVGLLGLPQMARFCFGNTRIASDCYSDILFFRWFLSG